MLRADSEVRPNHIYNTDSFSRARPQLQVERWQISFFKLLIHCTLTMTDVKDFQTNLFAMAVSCVRFELK